jgi:LPS-assembly protein
LRAENSLLFQIKFKGLAGDSGHINSILKEGIYGYDSKNSF